MNSEIIEYLKKLIFQLKIENGNIFKIKSFEKAISIIKNYPTEIKDANELKDIPGIGKGILSRVEEILTTHKLDEIQVEPSNSLMQFQEEIGTKTAIDLYKTGITNLEELQKAYEIGKVKVNHRIGLILKYAFGEKRFADKIPRNEMKKYHQFFKSFLSYSFKICGSFRRKSKTSNDIDLLIFSDENILPIVIKELVKKNFLCDHLTNNIDSLKTVYRGYCNSLVENNIVRRIDIKCIDTKSKYTAIMYFTGSKNFNTMIRAKAKLMGFKLNEYYIENNETREKIYPESEKEIFKLFNIPYKKPQER